MGPTFCHLGLAFRNLIQEAVPVCPDAAGGPAQKTSEWARQALQFTPSAKQAEVLDLDAKYMILCCNRQWGKTTTIALKALHHALTIPNQSIVIVSRTKLQGAILIDRACTFAARLGHKIKRVLGHSFSLQLLNGSRIYAVAHTTDTSVGNTANILIVDEAALVKDQVYFSVSPFVGRTHGALWLMSTPRRQAGFFYNIWHGGDQRWTRVFSTIADCPEIDPGFLEMQQRADPIQYRQDFLCEFIQPANRHFTTEMLATLFKP